MSIPTPDELADIYSDEYNDAPQGRAHVSACAAVRDAVLEGAAQEAERLEIQYSYFGPAQVDGQERVGFVDGYLEKWLRSMKSDAQ